MLGAATFGVAALALSIAPVKSTAPLTPADSHFRVRIARSFLASAVQHALRGAERRLRDERCSAVLGDFMDGRGRQLQASLDALGFQAADYLNLIAFHDGQGIGRCESDGIMAVTVPGSRVVWVCSGFALAQKRDPGLAEAVLVHEALHTLGLREDPPSSLQITEQVMKRCGR